jgi:hypothetical protein
MPGRLAEGGSFHFVPPAAFDVYIYPPHPPGFFLLRLARPWWWRRRRRRRRRCRCRCTSTPCSRTLVLHQKRRLRHVTPVKASKRKRARARGGVKPGRRIACRLHYRYRGSRQRKASVFYPVPCRACACVRAGRDEVTRSTRGKSFAASVPVSASEPFFPVAGCPGLQQRISWVQHFR